MSTTKNPNSQGPPHRRSYESQLKSRLKEAQRKQLAQEDKVSRLPTSHPDFMAEYKRANELRILVATIKSRIDNLGYYPGGLERVELIIEKNKTNE